MDLLLVYLAVRWFRGATELEILRALFWAGVGVSCICLGGIVAVILHIHLSLRAVARAATIAADADH